MRYVYIVAIIITVVLLVLHIPKRKYICPNCKGEISSRKYLGGFWRMDKCYFRCPYCHRIELFSPSDE